MSTTTIECERWMFDHPDLPWPLVVDAPVIPDRTMRQRARGLFARVALPLMAQGIEDFDGAYLVAIAGFASVDEADATPVDDAELMDIREVMIDGGDFETFPPVGIFYVSEFLAGGAA